MNAQDRLAAALNRIVAATGAQRSRAYDAARAQRNGDGRDARMEAAVVRLEAVAAELEVLARPAPVQIKAA